MTINKDIIIGHWKELKGIFKQKWGKLTNDDLTVIEGNYEKLYGILQKKYGYKKEDAEKQLEDILKQNKFNK